MNVLALVLCWLACILPWASNGPLDAPIAMAAEKDETPTKEPESGDTAKDAPAQSESENGEDGPPGDAPAQSDADGSEEIFVPSEAIVEDIDVPFPVDI